ncbi:MAG TPA: hypothetical protein VFA59_10280 [Vicinamibacterales bacterium]|nr:hypothetical protein [Vicinamibacterales bacterium]
MLFLFAAPALAQGPEIQKTPPPLNDHELLKKYVWTTLGPGGAIHATVTATLEEWRGSPEAWSQVEGGYARRWVSEYAASAIGSTTKYAFARALHQDPSFVRCNCTGWKPRLGHSLVSPFKARTRNGKWVFSPATIAGLTAQNVVPAATWYPEPRGVRDGVAHAASGVLSKMAVDVLREFIPPRWVKKPF